MSVVSAEVIHKQAATMGTTLTTSTIGGAKSATVISGSSIGEIFFTMPAPTSGTTTQYEKSFMDNTNTTTDLTSVVYWLGNALDNVGSNGVAKCTSDSASDDSTKKTRFLGFDSGGAAIQEEVTLNGITQASGALTFSDIQRAECRLVASNALTTVAGSVTITCGSTDLGVIPAPRDGRSFQSATSEVTFGVVGSLDGNSTTTNPATAPGGITFAKPRTEAAGTAGANSGTLTAAAAQGLWWKWILKASMKPSADIDVALFIAGSTV